MSAFVCILLFSSTSYCNVLTYCDTLRNDSAEKSKTLNEVIVKGVRGIGKDKLGQMSISGAKLNSTPVLFGEHDLIKTLQTTSGVTTGTEGFSGLYVRGGENDQNLYLLNGLPLYNVYHFGGLFSTFNTNSVDRVDFYKGLFPATFGERSSSIVDVEIKKPDYHKTKGTVTIGWISGQLFCSTPIRKGKSAVSLSLRRTWIDLLSVPALAIMNATKKSEGKKNIFHYAFTDAAVNYHATFNDNNYSSLFLFYGQDNFKLGNERFDPDEKNSVHRRDVNKMTWGNWGASENFVHEFSRGYISLTPFVTKAFASDREENFRQDKKYGGQTAKTEIKPSVFQTGIKEEVDFEATDWLSINGGAQQAWFKYAIGEINESFSSAGQRLDGNDRKSDYTNWLLSGFCSLDFQAESLGAISLGVRANRYLSSGMKHWDVEPRASIKVNLPHSSSLSVGYSRITQYAQQVSSNYMYLPSDAWVPTASYTKPLVSDILSLGYYKEFKENYHIKGEIWGKKMQNIADYKSNEQITSTQVSWFDKLTFGKGTAYGMDLETGGEYGQFKWDVAYGLMWNWRKFADLNGGRRFPAKFDNRHKIDISGTWYINDRMTLNAHWEYMTGNRTTLALYNIDTPENSFPDAPFISPLDPTGQRHDGIDYYKDRNNVRLPAFHRLNLNLQIKGRLNKRFTYQWDFGLYNAYCRMNPFTVVKNYINDMGNHTGDYRKFKTLSLIPILPSVSYTLNF